MRDDAVGNRHFGHGHLPLVCGSLQQHRAGCGTGTANVILRHANAAAARRGHVSPGAFAGVVARNRDRFGLHLVPVALEFFGHELREPGPRALTHFRARDPDDASVVGPDHDPEIDFGAGSLGRLGGTDAERHMRAEGEPATCNG